MPASWSPDPVPTPTDACRAWEARQLVTTPELRVYAGRLVEVDPETVYWPR